MSDLEIPDRAWQALTGRGNIRLPDAARIIVAAELRRMVTNPDNEYRWSDWGAQQILDRADELDPPERTD